MKTCDISKVPIVVELLAVPPPRRDNVWKKRFYEQVIDASFASAEPQVFQGPDGFHYFALLTPEPLKPFESFCICNLLDHLVGNGLGVAINPRDQSVDWVFSCGDILTLQMFGTFYVDDPSLPKSVPFLEIVKERETVLTGQPSESYLPATARRNIRRFLADKVGVKEPGIYLMMRPRDNPPQQLVFSVFRSDFPSEDTFRSVLQGISWYLPRHYVVVSVEKNSHLASDFFPL
jgi:hypothetical protein